MARGLSPKEMASTCLSQFFRPDQDRFRIKMGGRIKFRDNRQTTGDKAFQKTAVARFSDDIFLYLFPDLRLFGMDPNRFNFQD